MADDVAKKDPTSGRAWYTLLAVAPDGSAKNVQCDANGNLIVGGLSVGDIEIGAVEIKDGATDNRTKVLNADPGNTDYGLVVRGFSLLKDPGNNNYARILNALPATSDYGVVTRDAAQHTGISVLSSAARTTTQIQADQVNGKYKGMHLIIDVTSAGTGSITPKIQGKDANGIYYDILVGSAITSSGTTALKIYPGLTALASNVVNDVLPSTWRCVVTANNANSMTYSVAAQILI